jgi:hypothetical protein
LRNQTRHQHNWPTIFQQQSMITNWQQNSLRTLRSNAFDQSQIEPTSLRDA